MTDLSSSYYLHTFTWEGDADSVTVTGSFDNWSSSDAAKRWSATCELEFGVKVVYKYIIDGGNWIHSPSSPHESDASGNVNNVLTPPPLYIPSIPSSISLEYSSSDRNVQVMRWDGAEDDGSGDEMDGRLEVLAGTCTSPSLRYSTLRALLSLFLAIPSGAFRFGLLSSEEGTDRHHYGIEVISEPKSQKLPPCAEEEEESSLVQSGFYVLVQPAEVPSPILKNPSKHSTPLSHHLSLTSHQMLSHQRSTDSLASSSASFSTALSTTVSDDFAAFPFTPTAARLTPFLSYAAPATSLERAQCEEYLEGHWVECVNRWVRGRGHVDELVEIGTDDEWEEA
ncbi:hypothetical protein RQP46_009770 [Phenoliferia psychrophenolica]